MVLRGGCAAHGAHGVGVCDGATSWVRGVCLRCEGRGLACVLRCVDSAGIEGDEGLGVSVFVGFVCVQASQRKLNQTGGGVARDS